MYPVHNVFLLMSVIADCMEMSVKMYKLNSIIAAPVVCDQCAA